MRIDKLLVDRGLVETRERARALIMAGDVLVADRPVPKAGFAVAEDAPIRLRRPPHDFVSRGGVKLEGALETWGIDPAGLVALDVGASTGGFTDCLLRRGARRVYAVDVDVSQLDWTLRRDERVVPIEGNARYMSPDWIPERPDLAVVDVSFISLTKVLGPVASVLPSGGRCLALVKPQFELGRENVGKGGVVTDPELHRRAVGSVEAAAREMTTLRSLGAAPAAITGKEGNQEFFVLLVNP